MDVAADRFFCLLYNGCCFFPVVGFLSGSSSIFCCCFLLCTSLLLFLSWGGLVFERFEASATEKPCARLGGFFGGFSQMLHNGWAGHASVFKSGGIALYVERTPFVGDSWPFLSFSPFTVSHALREVWSRGFWVGGCSKKHSPLPPV